MNTFETAAIISLVDHLSTPLRNLSSQVAGHESDLARSSARMATIGQRVTYQLTVPVIAATKDLMDRSLEFSKIENTIRGALEQRAKSVDNLTMSTQAYAAAQIAASKVASQAAYDGASGLPKGMVNVREHQEAWAAAGCVDTILS